MNFFDTNVLVAATLQTHVHHRGCYARLTLIRETGGACAAHSMAEAFAVLTGLPIPYRISAHDAMRVIEDTMTFSSLVSLTPEETIDTLRELSERNLGGGLAFDALLLACARKIDASTIYTYNIKHFRQIAPDLAARIHLP